MKEFINSMFIENIPMWLFVIILIVAIIATILFSIIKVLEPKNPRAILAVFLSTLLCSLLTVPLSFNIEKLVRNKTVQLALNEQKEAIEKAKLELKNIQLENQNLELRNQAIANSIEQKALQDEISLLKSSQISFMKFQSILDLALLETNIKQNQVIKEPLTEIQKGRGVIADNYFDEYLGIINYDIDAKFGIDLKNVKIKKIDKDTVHISKLMPKYIGSPKNSHNKIVSEIRRNNYKDGVIASIKVSQEFTDIKKAEEFADKNIKEYQESLANMNQFEYMKNPIISLGQKFLEVIFSPVYKNIVFVEEDEEGSILLEDYFSAQIKETEEAAEKLQEVQKSIESLSEDSFMEEVN